MARSRIMERGRLKELQEIKKLTPSERLVIAARLSDICLALAKAGRRASSGCRSKKISKTCR